MKRLFNLMALAIFAATLVSGCQKYDDTQIRQEIKDLGERVSKLEAWCKSSQAAVDAVATLQEAVKNMRSVESVEYFIEEDGSGYIITFTNKQTIKLYNGEDGDAFFGNVNVGSTSVEFILADGTSFIVDRVTSSISFDSFDTKAVTKGSTVWTVMDKNFKKEDFAAFTAELKTDDGTATSIATKSATDGNPWKIEAVAPEFGEDGKLVKPAGVIFKETPKAGSKGVLKVALITNDGKESAASIVVEAVPNYLAFEAVEAGATVSMEIVGQCTAPSLEYSTDLNEWTTFDFGSPQTITLKNVGDRVYWRNAGKTDHFSKDNENYVHFVLGDKKIAAEGNIMSLVDSSCVSLIIPTDWCFKALFHECASLTRAPELPATELTLACYSDMFRDCTSLEEAPELPGTEMADSCYYGMFYNCASLVKAPELPSIDLAESCYSDMFLYCTSLKAAPVLPATHLTYGCYWGMFAGCESLEKAPELSSTELAPFCYANMFEDCCSITEAPELPATELAENCYLFMFGFCTSLKEAPVLPATKLAEACYRNMFRYCTSLKEAPVLPATKLAKDCYYLMFYLCYSLEAAPDLPSDELAVNCYAGMFFECLSLESAPYLPAKKLVSGCYDSMFRDCPNLKSIKVAFTDWADGTATPDWVSGVAAEGNFECSESLEVKYGKDYIPTGWSVNGAVPVSATKSVAEPAAKSISGSLCNSPASKTLKIQNRLDGRGMITL